MNKWESITRDLYREDNYRRMPEVYAFIRAEIAAAKPRTILDIGCGDGSLFDGLSGLRLFGVDVSREQIAIARKRGMDARYCNVDEKSLPFKTGSFDMVIASEVIEHVLVPDRLLSEARRVLKDAGKFILTTPNLASFGKRLLLLFGKNPFIELSPLEPDAVGHVRYFIYPTLVTLLSRNGWRVVKHTSDVINFDGSGRLCSRTLARIAPGFGRSILCVLEKQHDAAISHR
ncbi:MAG: class I SAM-dependent methyltransferase [Spirochaetota bacterium]